MTTVSALLMPRSMERSTSPSFFWTCLETEEKKDTGNIHKNMIRQRRPPHTVRGTHGGYIEHSLTYTTPLPPVASTVWRFPHPTAITFPTLKMCLGTSTSQVSPVPSCQYMLLPHTNRVEFSRRKIV